VRLIRNPLFLCVSEISAIVNPFRLSLNSRCSSCDCGSWCGSLPPEFAADSQSCVSVREIGNPVGHLRILVVGCRIVAAIG
jgi:hypothetical protein